MRHLSLDQMTTFCAVLDLGGFTAAARHLNLSQPAVSHQIRELEARLGVPLIERIGKAVFATAAGTEFLGHARRLLADAEATARQMQRHRDGWIGTVRVGTANNVIVWILPRILHRLRQVHPGLGIAIHADWTRPIVERIERNELDVGLVSLPVPAGAAVDVVEWRDEPTHALYSSERSDLPDRVTPADLIAEPLILPRSYGTIRQLIDGWFAGAGLKPEAVIELSNSEAIKALVAANVGATVLPGEYGVNHGGGSIVARPLEPPLIRKLAIVTRRYRTLDRASQIFIKTLMEAGATSGAQSTEPA